MGRGSLFANPKEAPRKKLSALEKAQQKAAKERILPDGRIRYYEQERLARNPGKTRGSSFVTEYNSKTGSVRQWIENYDHSGNVVRVHPKSINGQIVNSPHYPPTGREIAGGLP